MEGSPSACQHRDRVTVPDHIRYSAKSTFPAISVPGNDFRAAFSRLRNTLWVVRVFSSRWPRR
jgi:hypothetical protein